MPAAIPYIEQTNPLLFFALQSPIAKRLSIFESRKIIYTHAEIFRQLFECL